MKMLRLGGLLLGLALGLMFGAADAWAADNGNHLQPFTTDGCSMFPDGTFSQPNLWRHCCVVHDLAYWKGGTRMERQQADTAVRACVSQAQGPLTGGYMYFFIRWGGLPYWPSHYRWGYGWNYFDAGSWSPRGFKAPSPAEQAQIAARLPAAWQLVREDARLHPVGSAAAANAAPVNP